MIHTNSEFGIGMIMNEKRRVYKESNHAQHIISHDSTALAYPMPICLR